MAESTTAHRHSHPGRGGRGRPVPKGRQLDQTASDEVHALIGDGPHPRDMMIEYLHLIQDRYGCLTAGH